MTAHRPVTVAMPMWSCTKHPPWCCTQFVSLDGGCKPRTHRRLDRVPLDAECANAEA
jgi:hypothetical protein